MDMTAAHILLLLTAFCTQHTGGILSGRQERSAESSETDIYENILCTSPPAASAPSLSVHALFPGDISSVYALGAPDTHGDEASRVASRVTELLSMFNPDISTSNVRGSSEQRTLLEQVKEISQRNPQNLEPRWRGSVSNQETHWKLLLLLVPLDPLCPCSAHVNEDIADVVRGAGEALQLMQNKLPHSLVHVVAWSGPGRWDSSCECLRNDKTNLRLRRATLLKTLQDSVGNLVEDKKWHSDEFSVFLQPEPVVTDSVDSVSEVNNIALQLWTNMLQVSSEQRSEVTASPLFRMPCPTAERPYLRTQVNAPPDTEQRAHCKAPAAAEPVYGTDIPCTERGPSSSTPTSVHAVRPADIRVVAAVGDSLTAGNGVGATSNNILLVANEYRGLSWSIGGDANITTVTTLPNILKEFNPNVTGFSVGQGKENEPQAFLNQAVAGAKSRDMLGQVQILVDIMKTDSRIDFHNDWKVITMFVSGNDICDFCTDSIVFSARNVAGNIRDALDFLHKEVPRAIVNLVELLDMAPLRELHQDSTLDCHTWFVKLVCPCILKPIDGSVEQQRMEEFNRAYQIAIQELVDSGRYDKHENFTVVLQPFFREVLLPYLEDGRPDRSYFSPDCFHLSQKAHTLMARALWNNMLEPVGNKTYTQDFTQGIDLKCPSETSPFIRTASNSNYTFGGLPPTPPPPTDWGSDLSCLDTAPSESVPTSVHRLRPADIKVVGALGDSLTTAFGAKSKNLLQLRTEYKGVSWSIGGDKTLETVTTLPNIIKKFNPDLKGMSTGQGSSSKSRFNMAVSGAKIAGVPAQVRRLIDAMKSDSTVDFVNDWKIVTLFIGGNDLCSYCDDRASLSAESYTRHLRTTLDLLYAEVPRILVNVVEILQIEGLRRVKSDAFGCSLLHQFICSCILTPSDNSPELDEVKRVNRELQVETEKLVYSGRYDARDDFAVVVQPYFQNSMLPINTDGQVDTSYFSQDCFHFSERGHSNMATALWNNMLEPVGKKQTYNNFTDARNDLKCPTTADPYIFTKVNSLPALPLPSTSTAPGTSTAPIATTEVPPGCPDSPLPVWLSPVLGIAGLLLGCGATWLFFSRKAKNNKKTALEMNSTMF